MEDSQVPFFQEELQVLLDKYTGIKDTTYYIKFVSSENEESRSVALRSLSNMSEEAIHTILHAEVDRLKAKLQ